MAKQELVVIKVGGNVLDNPAVLSTFLNFYATITKPKILIHGGGKIATEIGKSLGIEPKMLEGRRITDTETLRLVTMTYGGLVNKNIVAILQSYGCNAIGLTGADGQSILAHKRKVGTIDYGWVGDITQVNMPFLAQLLAMGLCPVLAPLTLDITLRSLLNTNADTLASAVAVACAVEFKVSLYYCFEKNGVLKDVNDATSYIAQITPPLYAELKQNGIVSAGMIPKLDNAFSAINEGVEEVYLAPPDSIPLLLSSKHAPATRLSK